MVVNRDIYVAGLREACLLLVEGEELSLIGSRNLRLFKFGQEPQELDKTANLNFLLK